MVIQLDSDQNYIKIDTYKSIWYEDVRSGNYRRQQKNIYRYERISDLFKPLLQHIPLASKFVMLLGKKGQGVDFYRYYSDIIMSGEKGKWANQYKTTKEQLGEKGITVANKSLLDISGEPGFFCIDARSEVKQVIVTAFAESVVFAMKKYLELDGYEFDYQRHKIDDLFNKNTFDLVFARYSIGFCEDLSTFFQGIYNILVSEGHFYVSFSPASRAVCARWMFDDYTYLRQYTKEYVVGIAQENCFSLIGEWDEGHYRWDDNINKVQRIFSNSYINSTFFKNDIREEMQYNIALLFRKKSG